MYCASPIAVAPELGLHLDAVDDLTQPCYAQLYTVQLHPPVRTATYPGNLNGTTTLHPSPVAVAPLLGVRLDAWMTKHSPAAMYCTTTAPVTYDACLYRM